MYVVAQIPLDVLAEIGPERPHLLFMLLDLYGLATERGVATLDTSIRELSDRWQYDEERVRAGLTALETVKLLGLSWQLLGVVRIWVPGATAEEVPAWVRSVVTHGAPREALAEAVTAAVDAMAWPTCDRPVNEDGKPGKWPPRRGRWAAKGDATQVLKIWKDHDYRDPRQLLRDARLIAYAARECPDPLFARDIRGKDWQGGVDRSRSVATLCVSARWSERLRAAEAWFRDRRPTAAGAEAQEAPQEAPPGGFPTLLGGAK